MNNDHYEGAELEQQRYHLLLIKQDSRDYTNEYLCPFTGKRWMCTYEHPEMQGGGIPRLDALIRQSYSVPQARTYAGTGTLSVELSDGDTLRYIDELVYAPVVVNRDNDIYYSMFILFKYLPQENKTIALITPVVEEYARQILEVDHQITIIRSTQAYACGSMAYVSNARCDEYNDIFHGLYIKHNWFW